MKKYILSLAGVVFFISLWAVGADFVSSYRSAVPFPGPLDVAERLLQFITGQTIYGSSLWSHLFSSLSLWFRGLLLGIAVGVPLGILTGESESTRSIFLPLLSILQVIPGMAWVPIALLLFGIGPGATVFMITMSALPPVVFNTQAAVRDIPPIYRRVSSMMQLNIFTRLTRMFLPAVSPGVVSGIRLGFAAAWRVLIAAEMIIGTNRGLGFSILQARWTLDFTSALTFILIIALFGLFFEKVVFEPLEKSIRLKRGLKG
jgi:NitT/TauT family transport system permease protein